MTLIDPAARNGVIPEFLSTRKNIRNLYAASWLEIPDSFKSSKGDFANQ
ncbi:hypothetical protein N9933_02675 [bacterium]|nr:hypothetical protein [bacterium]